MRYAGLQADRAAFDAYVSAVGKVSSTEFERWGRGDQVAYLINAYNALVIRTVIDNFPIKRSLAPAALIKPANSVWQISGFFSEIKHQVAGRELTLDDIEHKLLRERFKEPRIHVALVCAARSCPPLRNEAYLAGRLEAQLDDQALRFLSDASKNRFDRGRGTVALSEIFKWFGDDFKGLAGGTSFKGADAERGVIAFAARYLPAEEVKWLKSGKLKLNYIDYDWVLNDAR